MGGCLLCSAGIHVYGIGHNTHLSCQLNPPFVCLCITEGFKYEADLLSSDVHIVDEVASDSLRSNVLL